MLLENIMHAQIEIIFVNVVNEVFSDLNVLRINVVFYLDHFFGFACQEINLSQTRYPVTLKAGINVRLFNVRDQFTFPTSEILVRDREAPHPDSALRKNNRRIIGMVKDDNGIIQLE